MDIRETIKVLKVAKAEIEWEYPMDYQVAFDNAIEVLKMSLWRPYNETPPTYGNYLCCLNDIVTIAYYGDMNKLVGWYKDGYRVEITAWKPRPDPVTIEAVEEELKRSREIELGNYFFGNSRGSFPVVRGRWEDTFAEFLDKNGFDSYGYIETARLKPNLKRISVNREAHCKFENDTFRIIPYYWGDNDKIAKMANFVYKPTGYELRWYKYPLRDAYASKDISYEEFCEMLERCSESIGDLS